MWDTWILALSLSRRLFCPTDDFRPSSIFIFRFLRTTCLTSSYLMRVVGDGRWWVLRISCVGCRRRRRLGLVRAAAVAQQQTFSYPHPLRLSRTPHTPSYHRLTPPYANCDFPLFTIIFDTNTCSTLCLEQKIEHYPWSMVFAKPRRILWRRFKWGVINFVNVKHHED